MINIIKFPFLYFFRGASYRTKMHIYLICFFRRKRMPRLASFVANRLQKIQGVFISPKACFDTTLSLRHPVGVVVGDGVKLGRNVVIYQQVTLGGARLGDAKANNYPEIGENTVIFAGAVVVGKVVIGSNCTIGANSVVTSDVPDGCIAVGAPARIIKSMTYDQ
ncbi:LbetaH domain-containing protein [Pseudomonas saudiphocaensis]|uniref:DapH/DapD/GlmU-related protein n=1 Tax=Pseudomonas saudiphocaensis TaxID=1499686 RepID=UPI00187D6415|nr:DapH/DapD/GlmU-related protein [Pseudomonas saudiphocaensis]MBE7927493.1 serine O-acetyltransferase [Pseudomonas saudiphocaensis]